MMRAFLSLALGAASVSSQQTLNINLGGGQTMEFVRVEPGTFSQGSPESQAGRGTDETVREVKISRPFYMAKLPVTRGQFARFVQATNYRTEAERGVSGGYGWEGGKLVQNKQYTWRAPGFPQTDVHPVVMVDFADASAFCTWVSRQAGRRVALPTEAQWEYASLGGGKAGEAWHAGNSPGGTQPVGTNAANGYGLHDMLGNAWEWCEDWYAPYAPGPVTDPLQTNKSLSDKPRRVLRGGAFSRPASEARPAKRFRNDPGSRNADNGFRVVTFDAPAPATVPAPAVPASAVPPVPPAETPKPPKLEAEEPVAMPAQASQEQVPSHESGAGHEVLEEKRTGSPLGLWVMLGVVGAVVIVFLKKFMSPGARLATGAGLGVAGVAALASAMGERSHDSGGFRIRVVEDGFWVTGDVPVGTALEARWVGVSNSSSRTFEYRPGPDGQFVFTGSRPVSVSVSQVGGVAQEDDGIYHREREREERERERERRERAREEDERDERRRRGASGYPSAY